MTSAGGIIKDLYHEPVMKINRGRGKALEKLIRAEFERRGFIVNGEHVGNDFKIHLIDPFSKRVVTSFSIETRSIESASGKAQKLKQKISLGSYIVIRGNPRFYELWHDRPLNLNNST